MKYKVGDIVRTKEHLEDAYYIPYSNHKMLSPPSNMIYKIKMIRNKDFCYMAEGGWYLLDEMIDCKVEVDLRCDRAGVWFSI